MVNTIQEPPKISIRSNLWVVIPVGAVIVAIFSANLLLLNYVHVFTAVLWTGTDIFMALLLGPILRNVSLSTRKNISKRTLSILYNQKKAREELNEGGVKLLLLLSI
jgi:hypothetical protein